MSDEAKEAVRKKIEDDLIELRDARVSLLGEPHGLVVRERDGKPSPVIRISLRSVIDKAWQAATARAREEALEEAAAFMDGLAAVAVNDIAKVCYECAAREIRAMKGGA